MASDSESMAKQCRRVFGVLLLLFSLLVTLDGVGAVNRRRSGGCQEPPAPANGGVRVSGDGRIARYRCDDQHRLIGRDTAICLHTRWSHPAPTCQPVTADTGGGRKRSGEYSRVRQLSASQYTDQYGVAPNSNSLDQPTTQRARAFFTWTVETTNATPSTTPMTTTVRRSTSAEGQRRRPAPPIERRRSKPAKQLKPAAGLVRSLDGGARNGADPDADDEPEEDGEEDEDAEDGEEENDAEDGENETGKEDEEEEEERASPERPDADEDADDEDYDNEVIDDDDEESRRRQEASTTTTTAAPASWTTSSAEIKMNEIESAEEVDEGKENGVETEDRRTNTAPVGGDDRRSNSVPVGDTEDGEFNQVEAESTPVSTTSTTPNTTPAFKLEEDDEERDFSVEDNRLPEKVDAVSDKPSVTDVSSADPDDPEDVDADDNELSSLPDASRSAHRQRNIPPEVDASILDTSCSRGETTTPPPPSIAHGVVSKYGRARSTVEPFNLFVEVLFQCETGYQLDTSRPDRLFCSNEHWIGPHPRCIQIDDSEDEVDNDTTPTTTGATTMASTSATVESTTVIDERLLCGEDRGGCDQICMRVLNESNAGQSTPAPGDVVCSCFRGFRLEPDGKTCTDIDECAADNGGCDGQCTNRPGGYFCSCSLGFRLASNGKKCIDNNECSLRNGHGPCQGTCRNTYGSYVCDCDGMTGTQLAADGHSCEDIDECVANGDNFGCSHSCLNTVGTAFCACPEGYMLGDDWKTCEDIDECDYDPDDGDQDHVCPGLCRNTIGSYTCIDVDEIDEGVICSDGFQPEFGKCQDINECQQNNGGCSHQCINSPGSWSCTCPPGLRLDPKDNRTCADVDECAVDNGGCSHRCVNVVSSFQCACPDGYSLTDDWKTCQDVDECELSAINVNGDSVCPTIGTCENLPGSYRCHCPQGFYLIDHQCQDIDECQSLNICGPGDCINQDGTYTCQCVQGYEFINGTCQDVDECERNPCVGGTCENSLGSFACSCPPGYYLADNSVCQDVDECLDSPCINGECSNEPGSFSCTCQSGYTLESNVCVDLDECLMSPCINGTCLNLIGAYRCECPDGFLADDDTCFDIDECQSSPCVNGQCVNTDGGYWCRCQVGYKALGNLCLDIDECETIPCVNGDCVNTQGSYECKCQPGYYLEDDTCLDVDECEWGPCVNGTCSNEPGSFTCTCAAGLQLNANSNTCTDVNECAVDNGGCDHQCTNTHGSFYCSCRDGYALDRRDGRRCVDVDECQQADNGGCSQICANQLGNYSCQCRPGFLLANNGRNCIEVVSAVTHYCPAIEPPAGGYLHCSSRPNQDSAYKPGTTCRLRCRKGYVFQRHKASGPSSWQNQVIDSPSSGGDNNLGLAILQGWKATQIWRGLDWNYPVATVPPAKPNVTVIDSFDAQIRRPTTVTTATESKKRLKDKADRRKENEKRHLEGSSSTTTPQAITGRPGGRLGNKSSSSNQRIKRQDRRARKPQDAGGNEQPEGPVRRCGDEGKWKGKLGFCRALTCPPLQAPANGSVTPLSCASGEAAPNQHCYFTCDPGFRVSGNPVRVCLPNLKWNPLRPPPSCEKVYPWPRIDCPRDMMIDLPPGARTVNVFIPQPATNVDWNSYVEAEPSWAKKLRAELGPTRMVVSFRARNPVTEYTAICSFLLEVRDREPPAVRDCPHDVHVRLSSLEPYVSATWLEPTFTDNIAVTHIIKSKEPGSLFALGDNIVSYIASDASGNSARCEFTVSVAPALVSSELSQRESCPRLESPLNGDLNCLSWTWGQLCRPSCLPGHVFFRPLPSAVYLCGRDRRWKPGSTLPDCAPTSIVPEGGCQTGWEERRAGGKQCVGCAPGLYRPSNSTVCIPCPMGTYQDNFSAGSCKSCPKKLTTCAMGARQCTDCKAPDECGPGGGTAATGTPAPPAADSTTTRPRMRRLRPQHRRQRPNGFRRRGNATVIPVDF